MIALCVSGCSTSREAVKTDSSFKIQDSRDSVRVEQLVVAVHDTIMETTTITIRENEQGDTLRVSTMTDRLRGRSRDAIAVQKTKTEVRIDTVFVAVRDSSFVKNTNGTNGTNRASPVAQTLKWVFWIIIAIGGLIIVIRVARLKI